MGSSTQRKGIRLPHDGIAMLAISAFLALVLVAVFGERFAPNEPIYFVVEHGTDPRPYDPGLVFPLGSDLLGRDLFSLVLAGAPATLTIVLLAGVARVVAGVLVAALGSWWRPARLITESAADLAAAVPATLVALILVKAFVKADTSILVLIGALLLMGWAGPYRVIRAEVDRLHGVPFTEGARVIGVTRSRLFWRHHLPHLVPVVASNLTQQVVASLVLVAELGVLGVLVGAVRSINVEESLTAVRVGPPMSALVPDTSEWGAMLASSRTVEALWTTRWLIFVPGAAFAMTAIAVAAIGFALARRYARRDFLTDLPGITAVGFVAVGVIVAGSLVPERYAEAREWSSAARDELRLGRDVPTAFGQAGLRTSSVPQEVVTVVRAGPAKVTVGQGVVESSATPISSAGIHVQSLIADDLGGGLVTGGGAVDAALVFAGRGIVPSDHPSQLSRPGRPLGPQLGPLIKDYPDDYAGIDVRGKVVLLVRFLGVDDGAGRSASGPSPYSSIADAIKRGAAAVLFIDPDLGGYRRTDNPYLLLEREFPAVSTIGVPVVVLDPIAAKPLLSPLGLDLAPYLGYDAKGTKWERSPALDLETNALVEVPLREESVTVTNVIGEVPNIPFEVGRVVVWAARDFESTELDRPRAAALGALARFTTERGAPFIFVDFDPHGTTASVREALKDRRIVLVVVLERLDSSVLRFESANGDLIPALDLYAQKTGAHYEVTRQTAMIAATVTPLPAIRTVTISTTGPAGDASPDATGVIAYLAGRLALGAPELPR